MIYPDGGGCSQAESLKFLRDRRDDIGDLVGVVVLAESALEVNYCPMRIRGEMGEIWLSACGTCARQACPLLYELGYGEACRLGGNGLVLGPSPESRERQPASVLAEEVYEAIEEYMEEHGVSPVAAEIVEVTSIKGTSTVYEYLRELEDAGWIRRRRHKKRGIELVREASA